MNKIASELEFPRKGEVFTHEDTITGERTSFVIDLMKEAAHQKSPRYTDICLIKVPLTKEDFDFTRKNFGIEQPRINRLEPPYLFEPIITVLMTKSGALLTVDGNHRKVKLFELGYRTVNCFFFNHPFWKNFTANVDLHDDYMHRDSGMLEWEKKRDEK